MDTCILCKSSKKDDIKYGEFLKNGHLGVHTFCLYLSSNLEQNGEDHEGFLGFLEKDIKKEERRVSKLKCFYCRKMYANIGCCEWKCRISFHLICGIENFAENLFCKDFRSYCHRHVRKTRQRPSSTETCLICYDSLCTPEKKFKSVNMILTPCCRNGWFHKLCLQKFAKTAGYFFKCPLCNDADIFRQKLPAKGIFIPNQDAAWELEPNAFADLLERPNTCSAMQCKNKKGRNATSEQNPFVFCCTCGSAAKHKYCLSPGTRNFYCNVCTEVTMEQGDDNSCESLNSHNINDNENEDEYIDVCGVSDADINILSRMKETTTNSKQKTSSHYNKTLQSRSASRRVMNISSDEEQSDIDTLQQRRKRKKRTLACIINDTETSENSEEEEQIKPTSSKYAIRQRIDSESQESTTTSSYTEVNVRIKVDSASSETSIRYNTKRKRKICRILSDTDEDEKKHAIIDKQTHLDCNQTKDVKIEEDVNENLCTNEASDDDPLEHFDKYHEQRNNISCVALRTRRKSQHLKEKSDLFAARNSENKENISKSNENTNITINNNNTNISSKGETTQKRKNLHTITNDKPHLQTLKDNKENPLNISCIANRTRRKTICAQTPREYCKENLQQSQIYEKLYESDFDCNNHTTDDELSSPSVTKTNTKFNSIVSERYKENYSKFEISCIANRTRRRKSLALLKGKIYEEPKVNDITSTSTNSSTSSSTTNTYMPTHLDGYVLSRKRTRRVLSTTSEESNTSQCHINVLSL